MTRPDTSAYKTFDQISGRLDEIIGMVRAKDTSLERSLDLFDEAIALGSAAVELVDTTDFTSEEEALMGSLSGTGDPSSEGAAEEEGSAARAEASDDAASS